jgi:beta-fructofuranosidase
VRGPDGGWLFLASRMFAPDGTFLGQLSDPLPVEVDRSGTLAVDWRGRHA